MVLAITWSNTADVWKMSRELGDRFRPTLSVLILRDGESHVPDIPARFCFQNPDVFPIPGTLYFVWVLLVATKSWRLPADNANSQDAVCHEPCHVHN